MQMLVEAGSSARGTLLDLQTQLATENVNVVTAENNVLIAYLTLTQLMNLDSTEGFTIVRPDLQVPNEGVLAETPGQIFATAENTQPGIKQADANVMSAEKGVDVRRLFSRVHWERDIPERRSRRWSHPAVWIRLV
jgi:outer membrane protein